MDVKYITWCFVCEIMDLKTLFLRERMITPRKLQQWFPLRV
jgi:hypothetical protein